MAISTRERNLLLLLTVVGLLFLASYLLPAIGAWSQQREQGIEALRIELDQEQRLIENSARWAEDRADAELRETEMQLSLFSGDTIPLIEAAIQQDLSRYARESGLTVNSTRLAERLETEGWLLISQEMSFRTTDANRTVAFLERLTESVPRLRVTDFSLNRSRSQYTGAITVVGFTRQTFGAAPQGLAQ